MKQLVLKRDGDHGLEDVPRPGCDVGSVLIEVTHALGFAVHDGRVPVVGTVGKVGRHVHGLASGDRVIGWGGVAEISSVPAQDVVAVPQQLSDEIALMAAAAALLFPVSRVAGMALGDGVAVLGMGRDGALMAALLAAQGCRVLCFDRDADRRRLAVDVGATPAPVIDYRSLREATHRAFGGTGAAAVFLTSSWAEEDPLHCAAEIADDGATITQIGASNDYHDIGFLCERQIAVRYTDATLNIAAARDVAASLSLARSGRLELGSLIGERTTLNTARLGPLSTPDVSPPVISVPQATLDHPSDGPVAVTFNPKVPRRAEPRIALIGAGTHGAGTLLPAFAGAGAGLVTVSSREGLSAARAAKKFNCGTARSDSVDAILDPDCDTIVIATPHNTHAQLVTRALDAGRHVWIEPPLALHPDEIETIAQVLLRRPEQMLFAGFNRRFSSLTKPMLDLLETVIEPKAMVLTVNAPPWSPDLWQDDPDVSGGRLVGEAVHQIDLLRHLSGSRVVEMTVAGLGNADRVAPSESAQLTLTFEDGSLGTILFLSNGNEGFHSEKLEIFCAGRVLRMTDWRLLEGWGWKGFSRRKLWRPDLGHIAAVDAFCKTLRSGGMPPISPEEIVETALLALDAQEMLYGVD